MAKYMINICYGDIEQRKKSLHQGDTSFVMNKYREWSEKIASQTVIAHKLKDGEGRVLDLVNGKVKDGPFAETKETIGGFYIVEAKSYEEVQQLASECPTLLYQGGYVEIREVEF